MDNQEVPRVPSAPVPASPGCGPTFDPLPGAVAAALGGPTRSVTFSKPLIPVSEAARRAGQPPSTWRGLARRGELPVPLVQVGSRRYVRFADLERFLYGFSSTAGEVVDVSAVVASLEGVVADLRHLISEGYEVNGGFSATVFELLCALNQAGFDLPSQRGREFEDGAVIGCIVESVDGPADAV